MLKWAFSSRVHDISLLSLSLFLSLSLSLSHSIYHFIYIFQQYMVVIISIGGFVADLTRYNMESAQYLL